MATFIVGSGPAAVAAAHCLLRNGLTVTMLDVGYQLESERQQLVNRLSASSPDRWDPEDVASLRRPTASSTRGIPRKYSYGSDYPYRAPGALVQFEFRGAEPLISHALGGLSNTWGAECPAVPGRGHRRLAHPGGRP